MAADQAVRSVGYWLKNRNTGIMVKPPISIYMRQWHPPDAKLQNVPGFWRAGRRGLSRRRKYNSLFTRRSSSLDGSREADHASTPLHSGHRRRGRIWWGELLTDQRPWMPSA